MPCSGVVPILVADNFPLPSRGEHTKQQVDLLPEMLEMEYMVKDAVSPGGNSSTFQIEPSSWILRTTDWELTCKYIIHLMSATHSPLRQSCSLRELMRKKTNWDNLQQVGTSRAG